MRWICARGHLAAHSTPSCKCLRCGSPVIPTQQLVDTMRGKRA